MLRLFAFILLLCVPAFAGLGQQKAIDSLTKVLDHVSGEKRVDVLNALASANFDFNSEKGLEYTSQAYTLAEALKYDRGVRTSLTFKGYYFYFKGNYSEALKLLRHCGSISQKQDDLYGYNLVMTGNVYRALAQYDSADINYFKAIQILKKEKAPAYLGFAYKNLARLYVLQWKNKDAEETFNKALAIYQSLNNRKGIADTYFSLSDVSKNKANFTEANEYVKKGCTLATALDDEFMKLQCLLNEGDIHFRLGEYPKALTLFFESLEILKTKDMPLVLSTLYSATGDVYEALGQNDISLKYYLEALKIAERIGIKHEIAKLNSSMAWIYKNQHNFKLAHEFSDKALALRREIKDEQGISGSYNVLGIIYMQEKKYKDAEKSLQQSLEIRRRIAHREGIAACLFNLALVYEEQKQYAKALQYQLQALKMDESFGNKYNIGISHNQMGNIYSKLKKFKEADISLKLGGKMANETHSKSLLMNNYFYWSLFYEGKKDFPKALAYHKKYSALNDSIYYDLSAHKLAELQALYQVEKKDQEILTLNQQKLIHENEIKIQRSKISTQNIYIISAVSGLVLVSLLTFVIFKYNRRIQKANREITEQKEEIQAQSEELIDANQTIAEINRKLEEKIEERTMALSQAYKELDTFFYRSSHDFRRPLTTFLGLAEVAKVTVKDPNALELFEKVKETATNLDKMLVKLQSISDVGSQQLVYKEVMIKEIFETISDSFRDEIHKKNIKTSVEIKLTEPFVSYPAMVKIIIENLVENAIHFSGTDNPYVRLKAVQTGDYLTMDFQDNGQGIPKEYHDRVFDMYYRANERSKGNGLGLYIVKKAVEKLDGSISVSSIHLVGSTFTIMLPMKSSGSSRGIF